MEQEKLKREVLSTASEYIEKVLVGIQQITEYFQSGREDRATNMMLDLIEGIKWLVKAIDGTKDMHGDHFIDISAINDVLNQLVEGYENMDYVLISDLLEYELLPVVDTWSKQLKAINRGVISDDCTQ